MKRFMYLLVFSVGMLFMASACGSGTQKSSDQKQEHGIETHEHGTETHDHANDHAEQEEFMFGDSASTSTTEEHHDHDHNDGHDH